MALRTPVGPGGAGDDAARFEDLLADRDLLVRWCRRAVGDDALADDMVQDAYLEAFRQFGSLDQETSLLPWLATVAKRRGLNELRRRRYSMSVEDVPESRTNAEPDPAEVVVKRDEVDRVTEALTSLTGRERRLLLRRAQSELSIARLAEEECSTPASVRSVLGRARAKLRDACGEPDARALAPLGVLGAWMRRRFTDLSLRLQQVGPNAAAGTERLGEVMAAAVVVVAVTAPSAATPREVVDATTRSAASSVLVHASSLAGWISSPTGDDLVESDGSSLGALQSRSAEDAAQPSTAGSTSDDPAGTSTSRGAPDPFEEAGWAHNPVPPPPSASSPTRNAPLLGVPGAPTYEPEDAHIVDIKTVSSGTVFALGRLPGQCTASCSVLFVSSDGGRTWTDLSADGLADAHTLLPAPGYPTDSRVFAMSAEAGLLRSTDGGSTFHPAPGFSGQGPVAMSPGFSQGDDRILVGSAPPVVYDAARERTRPFAGVPPAGILSQFAFHPDDPRVVFAGSQAHGANGVKKPAVYRCVEEMCTEHTVLSGMVGVPEVFVASRADAALTVFVFKGDRLFRSEDGGKSFGALSLPVSGVVRAVAEQSDGRPVVGIVGSPSETEASGGLFSVVLDEAGHHWIQLGPSTPLARGASSVGVLEGDSLLASPAHASGRGVWCSSDHGATWSKRCNA